MSVVNATNVGDNQVAAGDIDVKLDEIGDSVFIALFAMIMDSSLAKYLSVQPISCRSPQADPSLARIG